MAVKNREDEENVRFLLTKRPLELNKGNNMGDTALHMAHSWEIMNLLLEFPSFCHAEHVSVDVSKKLMNIETRPV